MFADANKAIRAMDAGIRPVLRATGTMVGRARTASCRDDFLTVMRVLADAEPGEVLVIDGRGGRLALAGEMFAMEAKRKKLAGIVVEGAIRDSAAMRNIELPVYSRWVHPVAGTIQQIGTIQQPVSCGGIIVNPGEIVLGDADGVICGTDDEFAELLPAATSVAENEHLAFEAFRNGKGLMDMLNFEEHYAARKAGKPSDLRYTHKEPRK